MGRVTNGAAPAPPPPSALEGDLARFRAAEMLQFLRLAGATGRLVLERPGERAELDLAGGTLVRAETDRGSVRLGELLVHRGDLAPGDLARALERQRAHPWRRLGAWLEDEGEVTRERIRDALGEVFGRVLLGLVTWREGRFRFEPRDAADDPGAAAGLDLDGMIFESLQLADEIEAAEGARG